VTLAPTTDLVASAWLRLAMPGMGVATTLPKVEETPALRTSGFVRVATIGGSPNRDVPMRAPVVAAECWAAPSTAGSSKPPWNRANGIAEQVMDACYQSALMGVLIDLSSVGDYASARVHTVVALTEPRRIENDPGNFARYDVDLLLSWTAA
jgi:hypothetical protein